MNGNFRREVGQRSHYIQTASATIFNSLSEWEGLSSQRTYFRRRYGAARGPCTYSAYFAPATAARRYRTHPINHAPDRRQAPYPAVSATRKIDAAIGKSPHSSPASPGTLAVQPPPRGNTHGHIHQQRGKVLSPGCRRYRSQPNGIAGRANRRKSRQGRMTE